MTAPPPADSGSAGSSPGPYDPYHSTPAQPGYRAYQGQPGWGYPADPGYGAPQQAAPVCTWHPDRQTNLSCTRCGRPACPECLTPATVGFHCRQCVAEDRGTQRAARTHAGSRVDEQPIVSYVLIGLNVLVFIVVAIQSRSLLTMNGSVFDNGVLVPWYSGNGEWWRLLTSGFLHIGIIHLTVNMVSLFMIGPTLERFVGRWRFLAIYLVSMLGGSAAVMLWGGVTGPVAGASGAIFGLLGALGIVFTKYRIDLRQLVIVLALNLWISFQFSGISWQGHVGGLVTGAVMGAVMVYPPVRNRVAWQIGLTAAVVGVLCAIMVIRSGQIPNCVSVSGRIYCYTGSVG
jgi:membrane associated rhomboid family serine protease